MFYLLLFYPSNFYQVPSSSAKHDTISRSRRSYTLPSLTALFFVTRLTSLHCLTIYGIMSRQILEQCLCASWPRHGYVLWYFQDIVVYVNHRCQWNWIPIYSVLSSNIYGFRANRSIYFTDDIFICITFQIIHRVACYVNDGLVYTWAG